MKVRRTLTLGLGAALGASGMYLLDPEHGRQRRREALRSAVARARRGVEVSWGDADRYRDRAGRLADRARAGFDQGRQDAV